MYRGYVDTLGARKLQALRYYILKSKQHFVTASCYVVVASRSLQRDGGMAEDHRPSEAGQFRAWTRDRI